MRGLLVGLAVLACLVASSGCGTGFNVLGPQRYPHVYGGIECDCKALRMAWTSPGSDETALGPLVLFGGRVLLTGLILIDFPLSFVADTLTLPDVLSRSGFRGWDLWEKPSDSCPRGELITLTASPDEPRTEGQSEAGDK
jgi:uncharacterized protein YceK